MRREICMRDVIIAVVMLMLTNRMINCNMKSNTPQSSPATTSQLINLPSLSSRQNVSQEEDKVR